MSNLHPDHLADLHKSGLTDETIESSGIYTVTPGDIGKKLGGLGNNVVSALAFPYAGFDGYERFKVWRENGNKGRKYLQKTGTPNHLYLLPTVDLKGESPLLLGEGEKKALALLQAGFQVVGISGIWNWCERGQGYKRPKESRPLPDFNLVNWKRPVTILFDSDGADNHNVRLAAWRLAREVSRRGGQVSVLFLPSGPNGEKVGADDFLVAHDPTSLAELLKTAWPYDPALNDHEADVWWHLRGITLDSPTFDKLTALVPLAPILAKMTHLEAAAMLEGLRGKFNLRAKDLKWLEEDIKRERKAQAKKGDSTAPALTDLEDIHRLHPSIDFHNDFMSIGFRVDLPENESGLLLVISDGTGARVEIGPEQIEMGGKTYLVKPGAPPFIKDLWGLNLLRSFMGHPTYPKSLHNDLVAAYKTFLDLPEPAYGLMAAWTVGTYYAHLFTAYPFLHFHGPKESGKSKSLEAMRYTCCNAWKGRDISIPAFADSMDSQRGTLLLDQAEKLSSDKETGNLIGLLADSYKKAGGQRRVMGDLKNGRSVLKFSTYGPKAFASTKPLDPDLADRCIRIAMTRTRRRLPDIEGWEPVWSELRDKLYRFTLASFKTVRQHYEANPGNGTRIGELWRPMLATLLGLGVGDGEVESIRILFMEAAQETRHEPTGWECTLLEVLRQEARSHDGGFEMTVPEILTAMNIEGDKQPGGKWVGDTIGNYHLSMKKTRPRVEGVQITTYTFDPARVQELCEIYFRETPGNDVNNVHNVNNPLETNELQASGEIMCSRTDVHRNGGNGESVHECSRTEKPSCTTYDADNTYIKGAVHDVHEESGGLAEKKSSLFPGDEVDPLGGEI